jgi:hypothetical protein
MQRFEHFPVKRVINQKLNDMRKSFKLYSILSVLLVGLVLITSNGCKKEDENPPELPPVDALLMDFSYFNEGVPQGKKSVSSYNNFVYSLLTVGVWNTAATITIIIPVAAYAEALNHDAVYLGDNSWEWKYSVTISESTYVVSLTSKRISNDEYTLKMLVSKSGTAGFDDFKWIEGTVRYDHTNASWIIYDNPDVAWAAVKIDWTMDWEKELYTIKYTCEKPDSELHGGTIEHGVTEDTDFDAYYVITFPTNTINIEWNRTTKAGRVKSPSYFTDSEWHCWDENFLDVTCGNI